MNKFAKTFLGLLIVIIPLIIILGLLFNNISKQSFYQSSGNIAVSGLKQPVKVYFDDFGVPQVFAQNQEDVYFTQGYLHARDRLWQMDLTRRVAEGRLSEIFGSKLIEVDKLFKTIGIYRFAYYWYKNISPQSQQILASYTAGVNKFIETNYKNLPIEFDALNYRPELWKPEQSLMLARMMAWDLNIAWYTDYIMGEVLNKTGIEKTAEIFPDTNISIYSKPVEEKLDSTDATNDISANKKIFRKKSENNEIGLNLNSDVNNSAENENVNYLKEVAQLGNNFFESDRQYRKFFNINVSHTGSNSWVVSGSRSLKGKPILANDPHLALQAPSRWYEIYLKGGTLDVRGMSFPGIPGIVIGNNKYISWGLTNLMNDDNDFIILKRDSSNSRKYIYNNQSVQLDSIKEKIIVKDSMETDIVIYITKIGPVISDLKLRGFADMNENNDKFYKDKLMTFRWTGFELSDEVKCFYGINTSKNWEEFTSALKDFNAPAQNFIYADISGNIGYHAAGKIPIRKTNTNFSYIFPGENELDWQGFVEFDKLPEVFNPPEGYIVTANTNPFTWLKDKHEKFYISYLWEPSSRFDKINSYLVHKTVFDQEDFKLLANSYESPYAKNICKFCFDTAFSINSGVEIETMVKTLQNWNGEMKKDNSAGTIYNTFLIFLIKNTFEDELGSDVFDDFITIQNLPYRSLELIIKNYNNVWFDNINTPNKESKFDIVKKSIEQASEFLKIKFNNNDPNSWLWGIVHNVKFYHPMGNIGSLDKTFNIGPFETGGDQTSVNNTEYRFSDVILKGEFNTVVGASMRMIVNLADIEHPLTINSTGQSGQPVDKHYNDQSRMWSYGDYRKNFMNEFEMLDRNYSLLILNP
ncbi:MAG: penicillin acylase family protein [Ignavibacteria bacterium]|nr:penicillin acylase family protein [Ignavibacteria bacterium]